MATKLIGVMVAGIGGASLGTEIAKSLRLAKSYKIFGCDVSATSYGLYDSSFDKTWKIERENYVNNVLNVCHEANVKYLIPGGEEPNALLGENKEYLKNNGITLVSNSSKIIKLFSDKAATFDFFKSTGIKAPRTTSQLSREEITSIGFPCIVKPATGSGGSASVFFAINFDECMLYADFIVRSGSQPIIQEYIGIEGGEFTIGVLNLPTGDFVGTIALKRSLDAKLSVAYRGRGGIISSGYSQGYIGSFPELEMQACAIAKAAGSIGPINIQGRVRDGALYPFEINPRFSASTYLRAMAGFNELDYTLKFLSTGKIPVPGTIRKGFYLRSLTEQYVPEDSLK